MPAGFRAISIFWFVAGIGPVALYTPREPSGKVTDGFVTSWAPSAVTWVFAKRLVRCAARSSAARCVSRLAVFRLLLFATACSNRFFERQFREVGCCSAGCSTDGTGDEGARFWPRASSASVPRVKAKQAVRVRRFMRQWCLERGKRGE